MVKTQYEEATLSKTNKINLGYILYYLGGNFSLISFSILINI
jgi:hypothetical protein